MPSTLGARVMSRRMFGQRLRHLASQFAAGFTRLVWQRTILVLAVLWFGGVAIAFWHIERLQAKLVEAAALQDAAQQSVLFQELRAMYTSEVVERLRPFKVVVTHDYQDPRWEGKAIPLPATLTKELGERVSARESGFKVRLYSRHPFRSTEDAVLDPFQQAAIDYLESNPDEVFWSFEYFRERPALRYATADVLHAQCVHCHNTHPQSRKKDWKVGDVRGVLEVIRPLEPVAAQTRANMQGTLILFAAMSLVGLSALTLVIGKLRGTSAAVEQQVVERTAELRRLADEQCAQIEERKRLHEALARQAEALANQRLAALNIAQDEEEARKRAEHNEKTLARVNQELVREIDQRHRAEAELQETAEELARSNRELELFASVASHDLQEPLRMVSSYVELLAQRYHGQLDDRANRWINFSVEGAARMKQLISDLLEFARIGTRGKPLEPTDAGAVFDQVATNLQRVILERGAKVSRGSLPTVHADATQLAQLLQNLIGNGIKFCNNNQPEVRVEAQRVDGSWQFSVRDNGIGIDPQFAERIFVIFQRLHTREEYTGTGIGLAVCKKIVERHGGRIWVESQPGQGATFFFTLPD